MIIVTIFGWLFSILFTLLTVSMVLLKNWLHAFVLFIVIILCLPFLRNLLINHFGFNLHPLLRIGLILVLLFVFNRLLLGGKRTSIYNTESIKSRFYEIYNEKMKEWPVSYEDIFLETEYGTVHVIESGADENPPMLLLHASGAASWSWKYNVERLIKDYKIFAVDLIGDAGKSEFKTLDHIMKTGEDQARLYSDICNQLNIDKAYVVGASEGGFIASNLAIYFPEKVEKLILLGPMGYSGAIESIIRIMFTQFFPLKSLQESTFSWAFSDNESIKKEYSEWFPLLMTGIYPKKVAPMPLKAELRQNIKVPVLFVFGERDNLVGNPKKAKALVQDIPNVQVAIVEAGHLMGGELPDSINTLIINFCKI